MRRPAIILALLLSILYGQARAGTPAEPSFNELERQFTQMPMEARRLTGPLFWLHGDESKGRLELFLDKLTEGHDGAFCTESRPHNDWLGPRWFSDLDICLQYAKTHDLKMWIFDEKWWPSQTVAGKVPPEYAAKKLETSVEVVTGPRSLTTAVIGNMVAVIAGKPTDAGTDPNSLVDLTPSVRDKTLTWTVPEGKWEIMKFTWTQAPKAIQGGAVITDGASQDCVDWFLKTVYQPHYDRFKDDFGKTIVGFFYDEPETQGDWGTELSKTFAERDVDWKKALVAWKFQLAGDDQVAAKYAYIDALGETWGRTMYGSTLKWCEDRGVQFIGHFMEHGGLYLNHGLGAINLFQMQKYCSMGGMDLVCRQLYPGQRNHGIYQLPKLTSSISHAYHKADDLAMCEIFGAYGQDITYPQMKWLCDQHQVRGVNFMIPHSFNPRAPKDTDCPPYFYDEDEDPRWPLYRVWADYTNRLSTLLSGGKHVCPIAFLFCGNSIHVGKAVTPEDMTSTIQDAGYDCDWLPYDVFEKDARLTGRDIGLYDERYQVLIVPPVEVIPYETLAKVKQFLDAGGVVIGYGFLPSKSTSLGHSSDEIKALVDAIWGSAQPRLDFCKTSSAKGRSYFLPGKVSPEELGQVLARDAGIPPVLQVEEGGTDNWLHVLHRQKSGQDVFLICNQKHDGPAKEFRLRLRAKGEPEYWDAMRNEITRPSYRRISPDTVEMRLTLEPSESVLVVFQPKRIARPARFDSAAKPAMTIPVARQGAGASSAAETGLFGCSWVWFPEGNPTEAAPPGTRWFRKEITIPAGKIKRARFLVSADNAYELYVNGQLASKSRGGPDDWRSPDEVQIYKLLKPGRNMLAVAATNFTDRPNPAGLIGRYSISFQGAAPIFGQIDKTWKASDREEQGWNALGFDDSKWPAAKEVANLGGGPWSNVAGFILPADPYVGNGAISKDVDLKNRRVYLEMDDLNEGASVTVNGKYAGGIIGTPFRLDVTALLKTGTNDIKIEPYTPGSVRLAVYRE